MTQFEDQHQQKTWIKSARFSDLNGCPADSRMWLVMRKVGRNYVIHRFNSQNLGYYSGVYKSRKIEALKIFDEEVKAISRTVAANSEIIDQLNNVIDVMEIKRSNFSIKLEELEATGYPQAFYH